MLSGFFVTKKGKNLLAKTHDGAHIQLTRAEIGNGDVPEGQLVTDVTQLYGKIKELPLKDVKMVSNDTACIPVQFSNKGVLTSFELKEVGIYALDPDDGEILYLYGNTSATGDKPDEIKGESEAPLEYLFNLNLTFDNGKDVKVTVDNGIIYATVQELLDMADTKVDKVTGKGLSTEDYTTGEKNKLTGIEAGANKYVHPSTHPVSMITGLGTAATKDVGTSSGNVVVVNSDGEIDSTLIGSLAHVGTDGYIAYPGGGQLNNSTDNTIGMLKITLPVSWTRTMLKFKISIFNYEDGTSVDYIVSGYNYNEASEWVETTAYCVSPWSGALSNLPVSFGHDGEKCAITVGTPTTVWRYPRVAISDITVSFHNTEYDIWKSGWNISMVTEALPTVSKTISNTNIAYNVNQADSAAKADKLKTPRSIALSGGATGTATNFDGSSNISIPVTGLDADKLTSGLVPPERLSPDPGAYTINPVLAPSNVVHFSLDKPTLAEIGAVDSTFTNKLAFYPYEYALCEISTDGGTTWISDPNMTETRWKKLMSENNESNIAGFTTNTQYRITINANRYCYLEALYLCANTGGNKISLKIEKYNNTTASWSDVIAQSNKGGSSPTYVWAQHSVIGFNSGTTSSTYYGKVRLTIIPTGVSGYENNSVYLQGIRWYGGYPVTDHRTIYSWDEDKNVTFPAQLKASEVYDNNQRVYSPSNKPTAADVGALSLAGGTLTGELVPNDGLAHAGTDGYIAYPDGGQYTLRSPEKVGMLKITLPVSWTATMLRFKVSIYNYTNGTSTDYMIDGYTYDTTETWNRVNAYCISPWGGALANLPVSFGHDGEKCAITIGTPTTEWSYPHVVISDVSVSFTNDKYGMWKSGWNLSFITEVLPTVNMTISNTNIAYNVNHAASAATLTGLTATSAELNYVDGVTSNIQTQLNGKAANGHTHTPTDITLTGGLADGIDPITRQSIGSARSNKSYGLPPGAITVEYSRDGGTTWMDYGLTDTEKAYIFDESRRKEIYLGKSSDKTHTTQYMLRVTIIPVDRYCAFDGVYHWINTLRNTVKFKLERSTIGAKTTFTTVLDNQTISGGYFGNNIHYFTKGAFGGATTQTSNFYAYRLTYWMTAVNNNYGAANIYDIRFLGADVWKAPGSGIKKNMVSYGVPYTCDPMANTTEFPGTVSATNFDGTAKKVANKMTIGSKAYDGSATVTITAADVPGLGTAATKNTGTAAGNVPVLGSDGKLPEAILPESLSGGATGQTWHAKDILGSGTTSTADATAESGYSVTIDTTAKNLNGSSKKYKAPFGTYVAIFRVQASTVSSSADKVKLEIWGTSSSIASRTVKLSDFSTTSDWEYFKIPFVTKSSTGREIYPKVTCLDATGSIKVDTIVVVTNAFALM